MTADFDLHLASASPRRRELLDQIGVCYQTLNVDVPEVPLRNEPPQVFVQRLALAKARAGWLQLADGDGPPVLGADTAVVLEGRILGKPRDAEHGKAMLAQLAGRTHQVMSAVALMTAAKKAVKVSISDVTFAPLSTAQIDAYWASGESHDKAGAYAIQGRAAIFIRHLAGSYSGVMGLPLYETAGLLQEFGIDPLRRSQA